LHFRSGVSYNWAEHYYRTALLLCRGGCVTAPHDDDDDAVFYESRRRRRRSLLEADARFNLGAVYWTTGQIDESIAELRRALGCYEAMLMKDRSSPLEDVRTIKSITCYAASDDVVESRRANVWHQLGLAYCLQGKHETSLKCLERALRLRQENVTLTTTNPKLSDSQWVVDVASTHEIMAQVLALQKKRVGYR
jgi:tetratricopeptide (TPR) repeat protein